MLNKEEARLFIATISKYVSDERGKFYDHDKFDALFKEIDEDDNGYLTRNEVAIFIKKAFKDPKIQLSSKK